MLFVCLQDMEGPEAVGGFDDQYDMDDDFIDDTEFRDYYGGDRRKAKYTGFFINKVSITVHFWGRCAIMQPSVAAT